MAKQVEIYEAVEHRQDGGDYEKDRKEELTRKLTKQNKQLDLIAKNREIKKKTKNHLTNEIALLQAEIDLHKEITEDEIERLKAETKRMRTEEDGGVKLAKEKLKIAQQNTLQL